MFIFANQNIQNKIMKYFSTLFLLLFINLFPTFSFSQCAGMDILNQEDFSSETSGTWSTFDVTGDDFWEFSPPNAFINGFGGTGGEEDWLISPALDLSATANVMMTFDYSERFSGPDMEVWYSTDYSGTGDPNLAMWTPLDTLPDLTSSSSFPSYVDYTIDLSSLSFANGYIAFKYTATGPNGGEAEAWRIDDICISGGAPNTGGGGDCEPVIGNYYSCIEDFIAAGGNCADLKTQLFSLIDDHTVFPYTGNPFDVWDFMCQYDMRLNDAGTNMIMWDVYSDNPSGSEPYEYECSDRNTGSSNGMEGDTWNREHVFPQSWWGGGSPIQRSDVNNLLPSDTEVNSKKGSFQLGIVATPTFTSLNGTKVGTPANSCAPTVFEPIDEYKGDMARMYFYIATRYEDQIAGWENNSTSSDDALNGDSYTAFEPCLLNLLLKWHKDDPVSQKELDRNDGAFMEQNNRNPYIDHPEYVDLVWGKSDGTTITTACGQVIVDICNYAGDATIIEDPASKFAYRVENNATFEIVVLADDTIVATAGQSITLNVGTHIQPSSNAHFYIDDCTMSMSKNNRATNFREQINVLEERTDVIIKADNLKIYPNPFQENFTLDFELAQASKVSIYLVDMMGKVVHQVYQETYLETGIYQELIALSNLPQGIYQLVMTTEEQSYVKTLVHNN